MWLAYPIIAYTVALAVGVTAFVVGEVVQPGLGYWLAGIIGPAGGIAATAGAVFMVFKRSKQ